MSNSQHGPTSACPLQRNLLDYHVSVDPEKEKRKKKKPAVMDAISYQHHRYHHKYSPRCTETMTPLSLHAVTTLQSKQQMR